MKGDARASVRFTANFDANLADIEAFWTEAGFEEGYDRLLDAIENTVVANLERFPGMGRPFLGAKPDSIEAFLACERLAELEREGGAIREYLLEDYTIFYVHTAEVVNLLSVRHFKQVSFDFEDLWLGGR
jgi:ParE toxin of type II toxin-antitoxin system, parDE